MIEVCPSRTGGGALPTVTCAGPASALAFVPATTPVAAGDLTLFLQALPDCRMRRGIRFPQWWMLLAQLDVAEDLDTLVCDGKTLRGSIDEAASGAARFMAQVRLHSASLGVAIAQTTYATEAGGDIQATSQLLQAVELEGVLVQADVLIAVKHCRRQGFQIVRDRLTNGCRIPWRTSEREVKRDRDLNLDPTAHAAAGVGDEAVAGERHHHRRAQPGLPRGQGDEKDFMERSNL